MSRLPLVLAAALVGASLVCLNAAGAEDMAVKVSTRGVDFADPAAVGAFYGRVRAAARAACGSDLLTAWGAREDEACRNRFIRDAVDQIDQPLLTAADNRASR